MRKFLIVSLSVVFVAFFCAGCAVNVPSSSSQVLAVKEGTARGINDFGLSLLRELWEVKEQNLFLSPPGIEMALSAAALGARGKTQEEMLAVLGLSGMSITEIAEENSSLSRMLNMANAKVEVRTAHSLWARAGIPFYEDFLSQVRQYYQATVESVDFADPGTLSRINQWVKQATHAKIDQILSRIPQNAILILLNAIYFKGKWLYTFDPQNTQSLPFYPLSGGSKNLPTMWQKGKFRYTENGTLQAIQLPYGDTRFSMYIVLPKVPSGIGDLLRSLDTESLKNLIDTMAERKGEVYLPRFRITFEETLNEVLKSLGMREAFDPDNADFSGMLPIPPVAFVSEVKHKSVLEVNEEGTEAAAATSVTISLTAALPEEPFLMRVDHPFLLAIRDERSGLFLFIGVVTDPESL
ncbi:MAG: serpin family protein [Candidatus Caldatribacteriaceae bacterium]